jgi:hypothetical protein
MAVIHNKSYIIFVLCYVRALKQETEMFHVMDVGSATV